jgi:peptidoglycan/LPS O-acetylase OafA/YrhL
LGESAPPSPNVLGAKYRPDIDGLRAIAVAAVVAFHAFPALVPGGFVGVDIFFVISGYLITGVIAGELAAGRFTFSRFYPRRVRRIFPALAVVLCAALLLAWIILLPDEWQRFGKHLFAGAAFVSNVAFAYEGGYFDWNAHFKPLLHLWSLGIEEQFYFVWPLFLALLWKGPRRARIALLTAAVVASFALNVAAIGRYPIYTFYLPFTRLWELGIGSLLALWRPGHLSPQGSYPHPPFGHLLPRRREKALGDHRGESPLPCERERVAEGRVRVRRSAELASWCGILLIGVSIAAVRNNDSFPGAWALLPTIGTALLIAAGPNASINRLLSARPIVFVGLISYPLYLWHWPIFSFLRIGRGGEIGVAATLTAIVLSFVLAWATYRWIERPIRAARSMSRPLIAVCGLLVVLAAIGLAAMAGRIEPRLSNPAIASVMTATRDWTYPFGQNYGKTAGFEVSMVKGDEPRAVLFIGDSHLEQYWPRIELLTSDGRGPEVRYLTNGGCPPLPKLTGSRGDVCAPYLAFAFQAARDPKVQTVVFGAYWPAYLPADSHDAASAASLASFRSEIEALVRLRKKVYVILASPSSPTLDPRRMISRYDGRVAPRSLPVREFLSTAGASIEAVREVAIAGGAEVIDPLPILCPGGTCPSVTGDGVPIYKDWSHMRPFYVRERAGFVDRVLR